MVDVPTQDMGKKASKQSPREIEDGAADEDIPVPPSTPPHPLNLRDMLCIVSAIVMLNLPCRFLND